MVNRNALVLLVLCAVLTACTENPATTEAPAILTPAFSYGTPGCFSGMTPTQACKYLDGPSATVTGYCMYEDCFEMTYGESVRVVAADEQGEYPATWFAWGEATLTGTGVPSCLVRREGKKKTRVEIPDGEKRCKAFATLGENTYNEHFSNNPATQCLGWLECKVPPDVAAY